MVIIELPIWRTCSIGSPFPLYSKGMIFMTRITNRMITDRFIAAFEKDKPYTPSEKRLMGIKLATLKKNIKAHLENTGRKTDLSVEQIIMDAIEYSVMLNKPYRSIASLGYDVLEQSLNYWEKRRALEKIQREKQAAEQRQIQHDGVNTANIVEEHDYHKDKQIPAWMDLENW